MAGEICLRRSIEITSTPHLVRALGDPKPIQKIRRRMLPLPQGDVLEIGVGPGVNFVHYDPAKVTKL